MAAYSIRTRLFAHLETWRPYTACYVGIVGLAGAVLAGRPGGLRLPACWLVVTLAWIAALYGGDYLDRELDAISKPHRPVPSGRIAPRTALACMVILVVVATALAVALNWRAIVLAAAGLVLALAYNGYLKMRGLAGNIGRGGLTAMALIFGGMTGAAYPTWRLLPVAALFWLHDASSNLVGAVRDVDGDRAGGYATFPVRHGINRSLWVVATLTAAWISLAATAPLMLPVIADPAYATLATGAAVIGTAAAVAMWRAPRLSRRQALRAHEWLVVERVILAGAFLAGAAQAAVAFPVVVAAVVVTVVSQRALRARHELGAGSSPRSASTGPSAADITAYVDTQLAALASAGTLAGLRGWDCAIDIELTQPPLWLGLVAKDDRLVRAEAADQAADQGCARHVRLTTTGTVFEDIFLRGALSPRQAVLTGKVRAEASPRDLLHINMLFNEFRRLSSATSGVRVRDRTGPSGRPAAAPPDHPELPDHPDLPPTLVISDTTLRDGEQAPGVAFTAAEKLALARDLAAMRVPLIEVGFPAVSADEVSAIRDIVDAELDAVIQVIARPVTADIDMAVQTGAQSIAVFIGTSDSHIQRKLRTDRPAVLRQVGTAVARAKASGRQVVFAAEDATRTDPDYLAQVVRTAADAGADAIGLADTVGVATPWSIQRMVRRVGEDCTLPIAVHCHNDLGLATANSIAALTAGASGAQCSLLGIGERAGNACLEEVAVAIETGWDRRTGLDLRKLPALAQRVAALTGQTVMPGRPVVGRNAFLHESGLHTSGVVRDPATYEPYPPELIGRERGFAVGKHSGSTGIRHVLVSQGIELSAAELSSLVAEVKARNYRGTPLHEEELLEMARTRLNGAVLNRAVPNRVEVS